LNKGDIYGNHVAGLHPANIFRGIKIIETCCCTISGMGKNDCILLLYLKLSMFLKFSWEQLARFPPWLRACHVAYHLAAIHSTCSSSLQSEL